MQLQQVLLNLLINGCDAMSAGGGAGELMVRTGVHDHGVCVSVSDCGTGIASADLTRIFEPFVTTKASGLGLGLTVCRGIAEAHGARLWAENNGAHGATFHFVVPASQPHSRQTRELDMHQV